MDQNPPNLTTQNWVAILSTQQQQIADLQGLLQAAITTRTHASDEPKVPLSESFNGSRRRIRGFINQIKLVISQRPECYNTETKRVALVGSLLSGDALTWFSPLFENNDPVLANFEQFISALRARFDDPHRQRTASSRLQAITQGRRPVSSFATEFQLLLADAGCDNTAAMHIFKGGLNGDVKNLLLSLPEPTDLQTLILQAISCDERIHQRRIEQRLPHRFHGHTTPVNNASSSGSESPMQLDSTTSKQLQEQVGRHRPRLDPSERHRRLEKGLCLYCGEEGHVVASCQLAKQRFPKSENAPSRR
jgi:hypothetical protein